MRAVFPLSHYPHSDVMEGMRLCRDSLICCGVLACWVFSFHVRFSLESRDIFERNKDCAFPSVEVSGGH